MAKSIVAPSILSNLRIRILSALLLTALFPVIGSFLVLALVGGGFSVKDYRILIIAAAATTILAVGLAALPLIKTLRRPISAVSEAAQHLSSGDLAYRMPDSGRGTLEAVSISFNLMAEHIQKEVGKIKDSRQRILKNHERFRRELASELHGPLQTRLLLLSLRLSEECETKPPNPAVPATTQATFKDIQQEIDGIREEIREMSHRLYPAVVQLGLASALRACCDKFGAYLDTDLRFDDGPELQALLDSKKGALSLGLSKDAITGIYRSVEEAICNTVKHASATSLDIDVSRNGSNSLVVRVTDNGVGFDPGQIQMGAGVGLGMIYDHIEALGGSCSIDSSPGQGTTVRISVPLNPQDESRWPASAVKALVGSPVTDHLVIKQ
ncbi:MAG: HAMP domain-containing protein [Chloroflexi bacterium]|nr:HAMP domain-containing protein [Chloroflexota bacterium]